MLVIGPGPGNPQTSYTSQATIGLAEKGILVFGICLGHQIIGEHFGGRIVRAIRPVHGKCSAIYHTDNGVFANLPQGFFATRYHSLVIEMDSLPDVLELTAWTEDKEIMGIRHRSLPIQGVQFHPESIASQEGLRVLSNSLTASNYNC